ncbi:MAG: hypothetical protein KAU20_07930 [Nanoarchaeota archaeon]|nr:hypothetical protein [Nanoarchaeota archaeon]
METAKDINKDIDYLFNIINWKSSIIDAKAAQIMNELGKRIADLETQGEKRVNEAILSAKVQRR